MNRQSLPPEDGDKPNLIQRSALVTKLEGIDRRAACCRVPGIPHRGKWCPFWGSPMAGGEAGIMKTCCLSFICPGQTSWHFVCDKHLQEFQLLPLKGETK